MEVSEYYRFYYHSIAALMISSMVAVHAYTPPKLQVYSLLSVVFMSLAMGITTLINFAVFFILTHVMKYTHFWHSGKQRRRVSCGSARWTRSPSERAG